MAPKSLDLREFGSDKLESQLESANLEDIEHIFLKFDAKELETKLLHIYKKFEDRLKSLKKMEIETCLEAGNCDGPGCAQQLLQDYDKIIHFHKKFESDIKEIVVNASSYNYNLGTIEDLHECLNKLKQRLNGLKITEDDSKLQKITHTYQDGNFKIEIDVELRQAMDD